ncbi:MAG: deaminase, partial [Terriglobales bacterium]
FDMTQAEFAERIGISQNYLSTMERGKVEIGAEILLRIGKEFAKSVEWLLMGKARTRIMIPPTYKPNKRFMQLAIAEAKRARDRGDYAIGAVITQLIGNREVVIASAGNRVKTSGSSIKHVELETLKYVSSGYGRYLPDFVLYSTHEPCAMCAGACVWSKIGAVVFGVSQEDITAYGKKHGTEEFKWRACLISCEFVLEKGGLHIPVFGSFLRLECRKLFGYRAS